MTEKFYFNTQNNPWELFYTQEPSNFYCCDLKSCQDELLEERRPADRLPTTPMPITHITSRLQNDGVVSNGRRLDNTLLVPRAFLGIGVSYAEIYGQKNLDKIMNRICLWEDVVFRKMGIVSKDFLYYESCQTDADDDSHVCYGRLEMNAIHKFSKQVY